MKTPFGISLLAIALAAPAQAQTYRILIGYPPGGVQDQQARLFAEKLREATGRPFIVETRAGASGQLAVDTMASAPADGATVLITADSNISVYPHLVKKPAYIPTTDFVALAHTGDYRIAVTVGNSVPVKDFNSFIAYSKAQPGPVGYGTPGAGTPLHFQGVLISQVTGARLNHIPYKGTGPALVDLVGGHVPAGVLPLGSLVPNAKAGKLRVLAQTGESRSPSFPDVPSFKELGYAALSYSGWYGFFMRAGTPADIVRRYNEVVVQAMRTQELRDKMRGWELDMRELTPAQFQALVKEDTDRWGPVIRASGFTLSSE